MDIFAERICPLFDNSGMTDKDLEVSIGLSRGKISEWRTRKTKSYDKYCGKIGAHFHVSTDYLLGLTDDPSPIGAENPVLSDKDRRVAELMDLLSQLPVEEQMREIAYLQKRVNELSN